MTKSTALLTLGFSLLLSTAISAQAQTMAGSLGLYPYPSNDQSEEQIKKDDTECYQWAQRQTGIDPVAAANQQVQQQPQQQREGQMIKGAAAGAATGVIIGDTGESAAKGAAIGAVGGGIANRRQAKGQANQQAQAQQQAQASTNEFNRAFSTCLEGRGYKIN